MPPAPHRPHPVDLLLCGHHYRVSQAALRAAVYDQAGMLITAGATRPQPAGREPAAAARRQVPAPGTEPGTSGPARPVGPHTEFEAVRR